MWFWWLMTVCDLFIPLLLIVSGRMMWKHPPKKINWGIGYRTERSNCSITRPRSGSEPSAGSYARSSASSCSCRSSRRSGR